MLYCGCEFLFVIYGVMLCGMSSVLVCFACGCVMLYGLLSVCVLDCVCFLFQMGVRCVYV